MDESHAERACSYMFYCRNLSFVNFNELSFLFDEPSLESEVFNMSQKML
jgi:hypothetical protein